MKWFGGEELDVKTLGGEQLAAEISDNMYSMTADENIFDFPEFVQTAYFLIDFDTEFAMEGIFGILENSISENIPRIIEAFERIGDKTDKELLEKIAALANGKSFDDEKADLIKELANGFYINSGFDMWSLLFNYLDRELWNYN